MEKLTDTIIRYVVHSGVHTQCSAQAITTGGQETKKKNGRRKTKCKLPPPELRGVPGAPGRGKVHLASLLPEGVVNWVGVRMKPRGPMVPASRLG